MSKINTIHDKFIRTILADKNIAIDYFTSYLPAFVSDLLDFTSLTQLPDTYLSKEWQKTMSDIVYTCKTNDENVIKVSLLIEHKSYNDKYTPIQIGGYIFSGLQKQVNNKEKLSVIIPVLLYHGKERWEYQTLSDLFKNLEPEWKQFIPDFDYIYNSLGEIPDEQVEVLNNKFLAASLLSLKHSFQKDWLTKNALRILIMTEHASENLQKYLTIYLFDISGLKEQKVIELVKSLPLSLKEIVMSTSDIFIEKGEKIGAEKTRIEIVQKLIKVSALTDEQIALATDVSVEFVTKIRSEFDSEK